MSCTTGYQFVGEEYCLARPDIRLPNSRHCETVCLLSNRKQKPDSYVKLLEAFLERGTISQAQFDKSLGDLTEKMGYGETDDE